MDGTEREGLDGGRLRQACRLWAGLMIVFAVAGPLQAAEKAASRASERTPARRPHVDHAVMPAGGAASVPAKCGHCQRSACPQCRLAEGHHRGHAQCQHGLCPAQCPVRPDVFGFYGTKWRKWPSTGVVQASNNEAAAPVRPPRAEVPAVEEESLELNPAEGLPAPAADSEVEPTAATESAEDTVLEDTVLEDTVREDTVREDNVPEDKAQEAVSRTPWRTFTTDPPRLAVQP